MIYAGTESLETLLTLITLVVESDVQIGACRVVDGDVVVYELQIIAILKQVKLLISCGICVVKPGIYDMVYIDS